MRKVSSGTGAVALFDALGYKHASAHIYEPTKLLGHLEYLADQGNAGIGFYNDPRSVVPNTTSARGVLGIETPLDGSITVRLNQFGDTFGLVAWHVGPRVPAFLPICLQAVVGPLISMVLYGCANDPHLLFRGAVSVGHLEVSDRLVDGRAYQEAAAAYNDADAALIVLAPSAERIVRERYLLASDFPMPLLRIQIPIKGKSSIGVIVNPLGCATPSLRSSFLDGVPKGFHLGDDEPHDQRTKELYENTIGVYGQSNRISPSPPGPR